LKKVVKKFLFTLVECTTACVQWDRGKKEQQTKIFYSVLFVAVYKRKAFFLRRNNSTPRSTIIIFARQSFYIHNFIAYKYRKFFRCASRRYTSIIIKTAFYTLKDRHKVKSISRSRLGKQWPATNEMRSPACAVARWAVGAGGWRLVAVGWGEGGVVVCVAAEDIRVAGSGGLEAAEEPSPKKRAINKAAAGPIIPRSRRRPSPPHATPRWRRWRTRKEVAGPGPSPDPSPDPLPDPSTRRPSAPDRAAPRP
jgi:hypothetical protein